MRKRLALLSAAVVVAVAAFATAAWALAGTWEAYPGQGATLEVSVQQPINTDGSSNFKSTGKSVIPVKFALKQGLGPFVFESIGSDADTDNDFSFVSFTPSSPTTFNEITNLVANYSFTLGDCQGGSLRWSVRTTATQSVFIYYGNPPQFGNGGTQGCTPTSVGGVDQSGTNMIGLSDLRYDTSQYAGGTFYDTYAHAQDLVGDDPIMRASLVLDSGWGGDQRLTLTSATVNDNTFTPSPAQAPQQTCDLPSDAEIVVTKTSGSSSGPVNEPVSIQPGDDSGVFRVVDCKLMYNLATSSLSGPGTYVVTVEIDGNVASGSASFELR